MKFNLGGWGVMMAMQQSAELETNGGRIEAGETKEHKERAETIHHRNGMSHQPTG